MQEAYQNTARSLPTQRQRLQMTARTHSKTAPRPHEDRTQHTTARKTTRTLLADCWKNTRKLAPGCSASLVSSSITGSLPRCQYPWDKWGPCGGHHLGGDSCLVYQPLLEIPYLKKSSQANPVKTKTSPNTQRLQTGETEITLRLARTFTFVRQLHSENQLRVEKRNPRTTPAIRATESRSGFWRASPSPRCRKRTCQEAKGGGVK